MGEKAIAADVTIDRHQHHLQVSLLAFDGPPLPPLRKGKQKRIEEVVTVLTQTLNSYNGSESDVSHFY